MCQAKFFVFLSGLKQNSHLEFRQRGGSQFYSFMKDISGVILAGGKSKRMGYPKAFLTIGGKRIIDRILEVFMVFFDEILIVTDDRSRFAEFKNIKVVEDLIKGIGPLGGIYTGLKSISKSRGFFMACDMPFPHIGLIKKLLDVSKNGNFDCVVPYSEKGVEPLYGIYAKSILVKLEDSLPRRERQTKEFSVNKFLECCNCKYIKPEPEELSSFCNVNTQDDLKEIEIVPRSFLH